MLFGKKQQRNIHLAELKGVHKTQYSDNVKQYRLHCTHAYAVGDANFTWVVYAGIRSVLLIYFRLFYKFLLYCYPGVPLGNSGYQTYVHTYFLFLWLFLHIYIAW